MEMLYDVLEQCGLDMTSNGKGKKRTEKGRTAMGNEKNRIVKIRDGVAL